MHELSIANHIIEIVLDHASRVAANRIASVTLKIGALSCVHEKSLRFSYELVTQDTLLEGTELKIINVPVAIFCPTCDKEVELPGIQKFRCPVCDTSSADIRRGKELNVEHIEFTADTLDNSTATPAAANTA